MSVWIELSVKGASYTAYYMYHFGRYLLFGRENSEEQKQIIMLRLEVERLRDEQKQMIDELKTVIVHCNNKDNDDNDAHDTNTS